MAKLISSCSSCGSANVKVAKVQCLECETRYEGAFDIPWLLKLDTEGLQFILDFVKSSGSLKKMASLYSVSYPTLRNKLNDVIDHIEALENNSIEIKDKILQQLESGQISAQQAAKLLKDV